MHLQERIILNPYAAKRLNVLLNSVIREHESRYGPLPLETTDRPDEPAPSSCERSSSSVGRTRARREIAASSAPYARRDASSSSQI